MPLFLYEYTSTLTRLRIAPTAYWLDCGVRLEVCRARGGSLRCVQQDELVRCPRPVHGDTPHQRRVKWLFGHRVKNRNQISSVQIRWGGNELAGRWTCRVATRECFRASPRTATTQHAFTAATS
jgi:hypothetical protein